jgi:6-phosphogluconolactonase
MRMKSRWGLASLALACVAATGSCINAKNPNTVTQAFMWVATTGDQMVRSYTVQLDNGTIAQVGGAIATGVQPQAMAITPDGLFVFIANAGDSTIGVYAVTSNGSLSAVGSPVRSGGQMPVALAVDPTGKLLFAVDQQSGDVSTYGISESQSSLSLTSLGPTPMPTPSISLASSPTAVAVSPNGGFVYATDSANNIVVGFSYDNTGTLTPLPGSAQGTCGLAGYCVQAGINPAGVAFSRCAGVNSAAPTAVCNTADNNNLFVSNATSNTISIFSACIQASAACPNPDGTLTTVGSPVAACCGPTNLVVDPQVDFVYVLEAGAAQVGEFTYAPVNGTLTPLSPASASTGVSPFSASISANTSNTSWIFVSNAGASTISGYKINTGGRLSGSSVPLAVPAQPAAILLH